MSMPPEALRGPEVSILDLATGILRRKLLVLGVPALLALAVAVSGLLTDRQWTAGASLVIDARRGGSEALTGLAAQFGFPIGSGGGSRSPDYFGALLRSPAVLLRVVADSIVWSDRGSMRTGLAADYFQVRDGTEQVRDALAARELGDRLRVTSDAQTGVVEFRITADQPQVALQLAQALLLAANRVSSLTRQRQASEERAFIEQRIATAQRELHAAEDSQVAFIAANRSIQNSPELTAALGRLQRSIALHQAVYTTLSQSYEQSRT